ncbi:MAG TPA: hypothetical protein VHT97_10885 [Acidimicrobiales bacterium]|nr:hypothetical protein [Acidimicrobiales bacterium]
MVRTGPRRQRRLERLARWVETLWTCKCAYYNVGTYRCIGCGRRPPRRLRAQVAAQPAAVRAPEAVGARAAP